MPHTRLVTSFARSLARSGVRKHERPLKATAASYRFVLARSYIRQTPCKTTITPQK